MKCILLLVFVTGCDLAAATNLNQVGTQAEECAPCAENALLINHTLENVRLNGCPHSILSPPTGGGQGQFIRCAEHLDVVELPPGLRLRKVAAALPGGYPITEWHFEYEAAAQPKRMK